MNIFKRLKRQQSVRKMALSLYKRGMAKAKKHDHRGAMDAYTKALGMPDTPGDVKAMVLYNRALVNVAVGDNRKGVDDLDAILAMDEVPVNIRTMARQKLARMGSQFHKNSGQKRGA